MEGSENLFLHQDNIFSAVYLATGVGFATTIFPSFPNLSESDKSEWNYFSSQ